MTSRFPDQLHVEYDLGRPLTDVELQEVSSLEQLSDDQIAVIATIRRRNGITPMLYVRAIVPTADYPTVRKLVHDDLDEIIRDRQPLPNLELFERFAGRPLLPAECVRVQSFEKLSREQTELARTLLRAERIVGDIYLSRIVPNELAERRHEFAKHLAES